MNQQDQFLVTQQYTAFRAKALDWVLLLTHHTGEIAFYSLLDVKPTSKKEVLFNMIEIEYAQHMLAELDVEFFSMLKHKTAEHFLAYLKQMLTARKKTLQQDAHKQALSLMLATSAVNFDVQNLEIAHAQIKAVEKLEQLLS